MKKLFSLIMILCVFMSACAQKQSNPPQDIPTPQNNAQQKSEDVHASLRMFMTDGCLYYDTGLTSELTSRCGTMDGDLKKTVDSFTVPTENNTCNFDGATGYQNATSITKVVYIENEGWYIFKKIDISPEHFEGMPYCAHLIGRLPNADADTELFLLTESLDVTVWDVLSPLFSSKFPTEPKYKTYTLAIGTPYDKWGLTLTAENVTPAGCTLVFEQLGGTVEGELQTGASYYIETLNDLGQWESVPTDQVLVWNHLAYLLPKNERTKMQVDWTYGYGALPAGSYRIAKEVADFKTGHEYKPRTYYAFFDITDDMLCGYPPKPAQ